MPMIKFDVSDQDADESTAAPEPPPPGLYKAKILEAVAGYKNGDDGKPDKSAPRIEVTYEVIESADGKNPKVKGGRVWDYVTFYDTTKRRLDQFLQAIGVATKSKRTGQFDPEKAAKGKIVKIRVSPDRGSEEYRPKVGGVWKWDGAAGDEPGTEDDGLATPTPAKAAAGKKAAPAKKAAGATKKAAAPKPPDYQALANAADEEGDDAAAAKLTEFASAAGLDPDDYPTWADLADALVGGGEDGAEEPSEPEGPSLAELGEAADAEPEGEAAAKLTELSEANGIDTNDYATWAELATYLEEQGVDPNAAEEDPF